MGPKPLVRYSDLSGPCGSLPLYLDAALSSQPKLLETIFLVWLFERSFPSFSGAVHRIGEFVAEKACAEPGSPMQEGRIVVPLRQ